MNSGLSGACTASNWSSGVTSAPSALTQGAPNGGDNTAYINTLRSNLAVTLNSFTATEAEDHVLVAWETVSELDNLGFNLYRSTDEGVMGERLNEELIPSQAPGSGQGFRYEWADYGVSAGVSYYYWLEDVDFAGNTTLHGPVSLFYNPSPTALTLDALSASPSQTDNRGGATALLLAGLAGIALLRRRR